VSKTRNGTTRTSVTRPFISRKLFLSLSFVEFAFVKLNKSEQKHVVQKPALKIFSHLEGISLVNKGFIIIWL